MSDAIRDQLIEEGAQAVFDSEVIGPYDALVDREPVREIVRCALDALLAQRDSDGIPLVLGLVAEQVGVVFSEASMSGPRLRFTSHVRAPQNEHERRVFVPRLSEDKP